MAKSFSETSSENVLAYSLKICYGLGMTKSADQERQTSDRRFSLGLSYIEVMDLLENQLDVFLDHSSRDEVIDWLQWNDPNGVYTDVASMCEFGKIISKEEGVETMKRQILQL